MWGVPILNGKTSHLEYAPFFFCNRQKYNQNITKAKESPADGQRNNNNKNKNPSWMQQGQGQ